MYPEYLGLMTPDNIKARRKMVQQRQEIGEILSHGTPQKENPQEWQLRQWRAYAQRWVMQPEMRVTTSEHSLGEGINQLHLVCAGLRYHTIDPFPWGTCGQSIWVVFDGSVFVAVDTETLEAAVVAHIRNVHRDIESVVYGNG